MESRKRLHGTLVGSVHIIVPLCCFGSRQLRKGAANTERVSASNVEKETRSPYSLCYVNSF